MILGGDEVIIDPEILDKLTVEAKASARLRMSFDLRNSEADGSQRLLNAIEPGNRADKWVE